MSKIVDNVSELTDREKNELLEWMCKEEILSFVYNYLSEEYDKKYVLHDISSKSKEELWSKVQDACAALSRHRGSREIFFSDKMRSALSGYTYVEDMIKEGDV